MSDDLFTNPDDKIEVVPADLPHSSFALGRSHWESGLPLIAAFLGRRKQSCRKRSPRSLPVRMLEVSRPSRSSSLERLVRRWLVTST
jgi:hypothetical protein